MQSDPECFSRRHFLQWSAAGAAAAGTGWLTPNDEAQEQLADGERTAPQHPLVLRSAQVEVTLDAASGLPWKYRLLSSNAALWGETFGTPVTVTACRTEPRSFQTAPLIPESHHTTNTSVSFRFAARFGGTAAAHFTLHYRIDGPTLFVAMDSIEESAPFQLIDVALPGLVTVRESDEGAWLAHGDEGGSLAMLAQAKTGSLPPNRFWGKVLGTLPVVMTGTARAMCVQETTSYMDGTTLAVTGNAGNRRAAMGTIKVHRANGSACYDLNLEHGAPLNCGNQNTPNLLVDQLSSRRLDFLPVAGDPAKAWIAAGQLVRDRMPAIPTHFYDDKPLS